MSLGVTGKLILAFVTLLLGAVLIGTVATNSLAVTDKKTVGGESQAFDTESNDTMNSINETTMYTVTNNPTSWKVNDCPLTSFAIRNESGGEALTVTTDYIVNLSYGTFTLVNSSGTWTDLLIADAGADNNTYLDYTYCGDDYMNIGWGRTLINLIAGFFALAILGVSVGLFYSVGKETGII